MYVAGLGRSEFAGIPEGQKGPRAVAGPWFQEENTRHFRALFH